MAANGKKSFIIYYDLEEQTESFTNEQLGQLIRAAFAYEKRGELIEITDPFVKAAFGFLSVQLREGKVKYEATCEKNRKNGEQGGRPPRNPP